MVKGADQYFSPYHFKSLKLGAAFSLHFNGNTFSQF